MIWPFGRKSKKKSPAGDNQAMPATRNIPLDIALSDSGQRTSEINVSTPERRPARRDNDARPRSTSRRLTRRRDSEKPEETLPSVPPIPPRSAKRNALNEKVNLPDVDPHAGQQQLKKAPADRNDIPSYYFQNPMSTSSLQPEKFTAIPLQPTLRAKRSANETNLPRHKSSKRKADDRVREQEIKSMSSSVPKRPVSNTGGILARDTKQIPGGLNRNLERPVSDVSIPLPESIHSAMSVVSDQHGFKVSAFDVLSPRPTIRYSGNPRHNNGSGSIGPSRQSTRKEKQPMILEETAKSKKRIDELADDMDTTDIRELMERDRRRKEKLRKSEQEKLQRRLQRKADKQRAEEGEATPREVERGLGIIEAYTSQPEASREEHTETPESWLHDPSREQLSRNPFVEPDNGRSTTHLEEPTYTEDPDEPVLETAKAVRLSSASMSPPASPTLPLQAPPSMSHLAELASRSTHSIPEQSETDRRDSDTSTRLASNWTAIFRRSGTRAKRGSADRARTPSEFSNTSRDSLPRQMPPSAFARIPQARSGASIRTQSRFREDLPELPISPPESRVQSPELPRQPPTSSPGALGGSEGGLSDIHPAFREEVALSRHHSVHSHHSPDPLPSAVVSQSLASVDSEGSWLTGRPVKRLSQPQSNPLRESASSLQRRLRDLAEPEEESSHAVPERGTINRLSPDPEQSMAYEHQAASRQVLGSGIADDSDDESALQSQPTGAAEEEGTWRGAIGRHPTIIRQGAGARARSREGLLNDFQAGDESMESSPASPEPDSPVGQAGGHERSFIQSATSIELGKGHARHISAGSARLLNLPPRTSIDMKRLSGSSGERSPLPSPQHSPMFETHPSDVDE